MALRASSIRCMVMVLTALLGCKAGPGERCSDHQDCRLGLICADSKCVSYDSLAPRHTASGGEVTSDPAETAVVVVISKRAILLGEQSEPVVMLPAPDELAKSGLPAEHKRPGDDRLIVPLAKRLEAIRRADQAKRQAQGAGSTPFEANVVADANTPYRLLFEVLYTLGQSEFGRYHLMVMKRSDEAAPPAVAEPQDITSEPRIAELQGKPLDLKVSITDEGFALGSKHGSLATGCRGLGPGVTIPKRDGKHDWVALATCIARLDREAPREDAAYISAQNHTPYWMVVHVIDVLRGPAGKSYFPSVQFSLPR